MLHSLNRKHYHCLSRTKIRKYMRDRYMAILYFGLKGYDDFFGIFRNEGK